MFDFSGTTSTLAFSPQYNLPTVIKDFVIKNDVSSNTVNVQVISGSSAVTIVNFILDGGDMVDSDHEIIVPAQSQIRISATALLSYKFTLDNIDIEDV